MRGRGRALSGLGYAATLAACGTPSNPGRDAGPADGPTADAPTADAGPADTGPVDAGDRLCIPDAAWQPTVSGERAPTPPPGPRPHSPVTTAAVTSQRPTLRWVVDARWAAAEVQVCRDPTCSEVEAAQQGAGDRLRLSTALAPGWHFWRVRGLGGDGPSAWSASWSLLAPAAETGTDTASLFQYDANGDGRGDLVLARSDRMVLYLSQPTGVPPVRQAAVVPAPESFVQVGDLDGDGTSELATTVLMPPLVPDRDPLPDGDDGLSTRATVTVYFGDRQRPWQRRVVLHPLRSYLFFNDTLAGGFDFNDDGYGDLAVLWRPYSLLCRQYGPDVSARLLGDPRLPRFEARRQWTRYGSLPLPVGDYDGDGVADYYIYVGPSAESHPPSDPRSALRALFFPALAGFEVVTGQRCDFNGDGRSDLILRRQGRSGTLLSPSQPWGPPLLCLGNVGRDCTPSEVTEVLNPWSGPTLRCLGDVTGDGRSELYVSGAAGTMLFELGPDGRFARLTAYASTAFREVGDTNGDGRGDVLIDNRLCTEGPPFSAARCVELPDAP